MTGFNLSAWAIAHRSIVYFLMAALVVLGIASYLRLGRNEDPTFTIKTMVVQAQWPGATLRRHAASGHRADRAQAAGNAAPRLPEELYQGGPIDGLCVSEGIDRAEGGVGHLVSGSQEGEGHRADAAAGGDRPCRRRRVRRHLRHRLWLYRGRIHQSRAARLCRGYPLAAAAGARCLQSKPDRRPARAHLYSVLARQAGRLWSHPAPRWRRRCRRRTSWSRPVPSTPRRRT